MSSNRRCEGSPWVQASRTETRGPANGSTGKKRRCVFESKRSPGGKVKPEERRGWGEVPVYVTGWKNAWTKAEGK